MLMSLKVKGLRARVKVKVRVKVRVKVSLRLEFLGLASGRMKPAPQATPM